MVDRDANAESEALRHQQDREAIAEGLRQMEAGLGTPLDQAFAEIADRRD